MPTYIYRVSLTNGRKPSDSSPADMEVVGAHFARLEQLAAEGVVSYVGRTLQDDNSTFGIVVFQADSDTAAREIAEADPAVTGGLMSAEVFPFEVYIPTPAGD